MNRLPLDFDFENIELEEGQEIKLALEKLIDSFGWEIVEEFVRQRVKGREQSLTNVRITGLEGLAEYNYVQGGLHELAMFPSFIKQLLVNAQEGVRAELDRLKEQEDNDDD